MTGVSYSPWHRPFWRHYWVTMRPYLLFLSGTAGLAGLAAGPRPFSWATLCAFLVFFFSYGFGQALTDCFQIDTDTISSPYRPLVRGVISRASVMTVSLIGCGICALALTALNIRTLVPAALCVLGLATYTTFKRRWWGGPFYNAWIVALLPLMGMMIAVGPSRPFRGLAAGVGPAIIIGTFFSYANFVLMGYLKDISADRDAGYRTFPVVFGWFRTALASDMLAVCSLLATGWLFLITADHGVSLSFRGALPWLVFALAALLLLLAQTGAHRTRDEQQAHRPIAHVVRGFVLLRLAEAIRLQPAWALWAVLLYIVFEAVLRHRPEESQI